MSFYVLTLTFDFHKAHADRDADDIFDLDAIAGLEVAADDGLRSDARHVDLAVGILDVVEVDIPRHLAVDAERLNLPENSLAGTFEH